MDITSLNSLSPTAAALTLGRYFRDVRNGTVPREQRLSCAAVLSACRTVLSSIDAAGLISVGESLEEVPLGALLALMLRFWPAEYIYDYMVDSRVKAIDTAVSLFKEFLAAAVDIEGLLTDPLLKQAQVIIGREAEPAPARPTDLRAQVRSREQAIARMKLERELTAECDRLTAIVTQMEGQGVESGVHGELDELRHAKWAAAAQLAAFEAISYIEGAPEERQLAAWGEAQQHETGLTADQLRDRSLAEHEAECAARGPIPVKTISSREELREAMFDTPIWARGVQGMHVPKDCMELMREGGMTFEGMERVSRDEFGNPVRNEWTQVKQERGNVHQEQANAQEQRKQELEAEMELAAQEECEEEMRMHIISQDDDNEYRKRGWGNRLNQG